MAVDLLLEFQEFLKQKKIVPDKQIPFYAQWVSRFLAFLNHNSFTKLDIATEQFIIWLRDSQHVQDWQLRQASNAVRLYAGSFAAGKDSIVLPAITHGTGTTAVDCPAVGYSDVGATHCG